MTQSLHSKYPNSLVFPYKNGYILTSVQSINSNVRVLFRTKGQPVPVKTPKAAKAMISRKLNAKSK